jgi:predicted XRE-type DNA-binding protein
MPWTDPIPALKQQVAAEISRAIEGMNASNAGYTLGIDQPRVSDIRKGKLDRFSLETLIRYLSRLDRRIDLTTTYARPEMHFTRRSQPAVRRDGT